ncbi:APC family permease [Mycolicibacterium goodii]|uniref:APC family permease n=1 Tax=Mycolicibacterium goodii TaxID=134601 RepID=UPI000C2673E3|nr:APC family permease [Mycolicibacterium goodii]PJK19516.1 amino acid permease [Mycolicibacterium goodii]
MTENQLAADPPTAPTAGEAGSHTSLTGNMGVISLMLTVLAFSAPIAAVAGFIPFSIMFGGEGATLVFAIATVSLLLFAVGYVTMTKALPKPGSFYAFISAGLGKVPGLGAAFMAVVSYLLMLSGCFVFIGLTVTELISSMGGAETQWWLWALISWGLVSTLCYFHIEVSARILSVAMVLEVAIVMVFNVAVLLRGGGPEGYSTDPLNPASLSHGVFGIALLFAIMIFIGFEATALFRDEVRQPGRTIPRATYGAVFFVGTLYTVSCYLLTTAYGSDAVQVATEDPKMMFPGAIGHFAAPAFTQLTFAFIITSEIAAAISVHNVTARYIYNLGVDRALPAVFAQVHPRHGSPARAAVAVAVVVAVLVVPLGLANLAGVGLDAQLFGLGTVGVLVLMTLVSAAVIAWFSRRGVPPGANWFKCFLAPGLAIAVLAPTIVLAVLHFDLVVGGAPGQNLGLLAILAASLVIGAGLAAYFRSAKPRVFAGLGRADTGQVETRDAVVPTRM